MLGHRSMNIDRPACREGGINRGAGERGDAAWREEAATGKSARAS